MKEENLNPFFSVVISIYNVGKYLERCINSILNQDYIDFELILVDDGSTDDSGKICDDWVKRDEKVRVIHKKNAGLGMARNTGLNDAKGEYIFFFDGDDYILPSLFKDVYYKIQEHKSDIIFYGLKRMDSNEKELFELIPNPEEDSYNDNYKIMNQLLPDFIAPNPNNGRDMNTTISVCTCCINLDFLKEKQLQFVSEREYISEDIYFYVEMFKNIKSVDFIRKAYYCYCQNEGSLTFSYKSDRFEKLKKFYLAIIKLANSLGYNEEIQIRFFASFIASVMACLKMEVANYKNTSLKSTYQRFRNICNDTFLREAVFRYPNKYTNRGWKLFAICIKKRWTCLLMLTLLLKYYIKGI